MSAPKMYASSSVSPHMVVAVVFVALIVIVLMFVFRRNNVQPLPMATATASLQPSSAVKTVWRNTDKIPANHVKVTTLHPRKKGFFATIEANGLCKKRGYCESVQIDDNGKNYIFTNWLPIPPIPPKPFECPVPSCNCPVPSCNCPVTQPCNCPKPSMDLNYFQNCNVDADTGLPFWKAPYRGGHLKNYTYERYDRSPLSDMTGYTGGDQYNGGILPYNPTTGFTLYPYHPYTGKRLIDEMTGLPVAIDELGLARFSSDKSMWYETVFVQDNAFSPCVVGSRTGLPDNIYRDMKTEYMSGPGLPIKPFDFNIDDNGKLEGMIITLKTGFDKSIVQRFNEDVNNLPKHPKTRLPLYPFNPYTGNAIIDPNTGKPVEINAADGLAKFKSPPMGEIKIDRDIPTTGNTNTPISNTLGNTTISSNTPTTGGSINTALNPPVFKFPDAFRRL